MEIRGTHTERVGAQWMVITIDLYEGTQYKVGAVKIDGNKLFPTPTWRSASR